MIRIQKPDFSAVPFFGLLAWPLLMLLLLHCAANTPSVPPTIADDDFVTPPFYRIEGKAGGTILLMGTFHLGPPGGWHFSPAIVEGLDRADRFVLEVDPRAATEEAVSTLVGELVVIPQPDTLLDLVSPKTAQLMDEKDTALSELGMPRDARNWLKPWFIVLSLIESSTAKSGFDSTSSVEDALLEASGSRPLVGLETFAEQIGFFDDLSPELQDLLLRDTLLGLDSAVEDLQAMIVAWRTGKESDLEALSRDGVEAFPKLEEFYDILLRDRNLRWMSDFETMLEANEYADETIFVGVGALHLLGEDGLVQLLREAGYSAVSIDQSVRNR